VHRISEDGMSLYEHSTWYKYSCQMKMFLYNVHIEQTNNLKLLWNAHILHSFVIFSLFFSYFWTVSLSRFTSAIIDDVLFLLILLYFSFHVFYPIDSLLWAFQFWLELLIYFPTTLDCLMVCVVVFLKWGGLIAVK